ncbi:hypothetical protein [Aliiroseovarius sp. 2305UL8-7]|uniref:hypothetical protein n=1 Tax=Aliiroseovarius conchicola TaxID=3121637 RepID=UPI0035287D23
MRFAPTLILAAVLPSVGLAFCNPPIAPALTSEELAREFRAEFRHDFEQYFSDAQEYLQCLDEERSEVMTEISETAARYDRFLKDSQNWSAN